MIELPMIFVAGVLGTAHCVGMCGPLAMLIGSTAGEWPVAVYRQVAYTAGRVFTYGSLGAAAGFGGGKVVHALPGLSQGAAILAIAAGILLVHQGLLSAGLVRRRGIGPSAAPCLSGSFWSHFLRRPGVGPVFLAGLGNGFLPCGLLYGMLALAMSTHSVVWGGLTMMTFGLGTAPAMVAIGLGGRLMGLATRRWLLAAGATCLIVTGAISVFRGVSLISAAEKTVGTCPMCHW